MRLYEWFLRSRLAIKLLVFALLFCAINFGFLRHFGAAEAKEASRAVPPPKVEQHADGGTTTPSQRAVSGVASSQGVIYAPRDVVDMSKLVLDISRENTAHVAHYIEIATTVIVVFFSVLGALAAAFGLHKMDDLDQKASKAVKAFEEGLQQSRDEMKKLENAHTLALSSATETLNSRIRNLTSVLSARVEIQLSNRADVTEDQKKRVFQQVSTALSAALSDGSDGALVGVVRSRALSDLAWVKKRTGQIDEAIEAIDEAISIAEHDGLGSLGLLHFNAACYCSLKSNFPDSLKHLKTAVGKEPRYRNAALEEQDFADLRKAFEAEFKEALK